MVIVSSDNKTDQQEQIMNRLSNGLALCNCSLIKASNIGYIAGIFAFPFSSIKPKPRAISGPVVSSFPSKYRR